MEIISMLYKKKIPVLRDVHPHKFAINILVQIDESILIFFLNPYSCISEWCYWIYTFV